MINGADERFLLTDVERIALGLLASCGQELFYSGTSGQQAIIRQAFKAAETFLDLSPDRYDDDEGLEA